MSNIIGKASDVYGQKYTTAQTGAENAGQQLLEARNRLATQQGMDQQREEQLWNRDYQTKALNRGGGSSSSGITPYQMAQLQLAQNEQMNAQWNSMLGVAGEYDEQIRNRETTRENVITALGSQFPMIPTENIQDFVYGTWNDESLIPLEEGGGTFGSYNWNEATKGAYETAQKFTPEVAREPVKGFFETIVSKDPVTAVKDWLKK
jgi:hypothetical protein